jgi:hypothetical protein
MTAVWYVEWWGFSYGMFLCMYIIQLFRCCVSKRMAVCYMVEIIIESEFVGGWVWVCEEYVRLAFVNYHRPGKD